MNGYSLGIASLELGAGRKAKEDTIDPLAGIRLHKKVGDPVRPGETVLTLYASAADADKMFRNALSWLRKGMELGCTPTSTQPNILMRIERKGISTDFRGN